MNIQTKESSPKDEETLKQSFQTSLVVQWLRLCSPVQGVQVRSLVRKLRSHMPVAKTPKNIKQKQYRNKFNKDF